MAVLDQIITGINENVASFGIDTAKLLPDLISATVLLLFGVFIGKLIKWILKKMLVKGIKLEAFVKLDIIDTFLTIIKWVIYIVFIQAAIAVLKIPVLSDYLGTALGIIQGLISSVVILAVGFALARYLKVRLEKIGVGDLGVLGAILFVFIMFVSASFAIKSAFLDTKLSDYIILIIAFAGSAAIAWNFRDYLKKKK
jgi:hypothetical protein